jgi:hypothetical protein
MHTLLVEEDAMRLVGRAALVAGTVVCVNAHRFGQFIPSNQSGQGTLRAEQALGLDEARIYIIVPFNKEKIAQFDSDERQIRRICDYKR